MSEVTELYQAIRTRFLEMVMERGLAFSPSPFGDLLIALLGKYYDRASQHKAKRVELLGSALQKAFGQTAQHWAEGSEKDKNKKTDAITDHLMDINPGAYELPDDDTFGVETPEAETCDTERSAADGFFDQDPLLYAVMTNHRNSLKKLEEEIMRTAVMMRRRSAKASEVKNSRIWDSAQSSDYLYCWTDYALKTEREDLKEIYTRLLAGEIANPGHAWIRTLEVVHTLSEAELKLFEQYAPYMAGDMLVSTQDDPDLDPEKIETLREAGLLSGTVSTSATKCVTSEQGADGFGYATDYGLDYLITLFFEMKTGLTTDKTGYKVSSAGRELLANALEFEPKLQYLEHIVRCLKSVGSDPYVAVLKRNRTGGKLASQEKPLLEAGNLGFSNLGFSRDAANSTNDSGEDDSEKNAPRGRGS
ncbi:MAG: DUF2806 domain-containing protein [Succinivibrio sp.]|nr:DUF2806 domain-containing protein [Succinivibrio sp.]